MVKVNNYVGRVETNVKAFSGTNEDIQMDIMKFNSLLIETKERMHEKLVANHRSIQEEMDKMKDELEALKLTEDKFDWRIKKV